MGHYTLFLYKKKEEKSNAPQPWEKKGDGTQAVYN